MRSSSLSLHSWTAVALLATVGCGPKPTPDPGLGSGSGGSGGSAVGSGSGGSGALHREDALLVRSGSGGGGGGITLGTSSRGVASSMKSVADRLHDAIGDTGTQLVVADRAAMMAAWAAADTAARLSALYADRHAGNASDLVHTAAAKLPSDVSALLGDAHSAAIQTHAAQLYADANALSAALSTPPPPQPGTERRTLPTVTTGQCVELTNAMVADLGGIATSEITYANTRGGYPWASLASAAVAAKTDFGSLTKPGFATALTAPTSTVLAASRARIHTWFGADAAKTAAATGTFDRAVQHGFDPRAALILARGSLLLEADFGVLETAIKTQTSALTANASAAQAELAQVAALVDGLHSGARARAAMLAAGKSPGVIANVSATWTAADRQLAANQKLLEACAMQTSGLDATREKTVTALAMITAFGTLPATCATTDDCDGGQQCVAKACVTTCGCDGDGETCNTADNKCKFAPQCSVTADCAAFPGTVCAGNECRATCGAATCTDEQECTSTCKARGACSTCGPTQFCDENAAAAPTCKADATRGCSTDADCVIAGVPSQVVPHCVTVANDDNQPVKMCIGVGWSCRQAGDCSWGTECDLAAGQCVDREAYACSTTNECRPAETCILENGTTHRCEAGNVAAGSGCDATVHDGHPVYGPCNNGKWVDDGHGALRCDPGQPSAETCDGVDNNCNGVPDDGIAVTSCAANAPGECAHGTTTCSGGKPGCAPSAAVPEVCDGKDNDCDGTADNHIASQACDAQAPGDCRNSYQVCSNGGLSCPPASPQGEVCDHRDNDCNGQIDDIHTSHDSHETDAIATFQSLFGVSENHVFGPANCGGTRESAASDKMTSGDSWCAVVDWADLACRDPHRAVGHSDIGDACKAFFQDGGVSDDNDHPNDCRYIVHFGTTGNTQLTCTMSHMVNVADHCN